MEDLQGEHLEQYEELLEEFKVERYEKQWQDVVSKHLDYSQIQVLGDSQAQWNEEKELYVCAVMLRPGKHQYIVKSEKNQY